MTANSRSSLYSSPSGACCQLLPCACVHRSRRGTNGRQYVADIETRQILRLAEIKRKKSVQSRPQPRACARLGVTLISQITKTDCDGANDDPTLILQKPLDLCFRNEVRVQRESCFRKPHTRRWPNTRCFLARGDRNPSQQPAYSSSTRLWGSLLGGLSRLRLPTS